MAIIDLYLYRPEMKTTPQLFCHNCENPLHHSELLSNPRWKKSSPIRVLSEYLSSGNRERIKNSNKCNNLDNCYHHYHRYQYHQFHNHDHRNDNINDINLKHTERMHSNHRSVLVNSNESSFQPVDLLTIHPENKNFELMKIKRIYGLIDYMLMSNHICCKHFESVQKFMNQLQAIVKPTEKDVDNKLRNLMNLSMHKFSEKVVAKGLKHLRNICKCPECNKNSQLGSEINEFTGETSYQYNNHNHNSVKFRKSEPQNSKSTKNKIKHPLDYRTTSFWTSCLSNTEVSDQELDRVDRSTSRSVCSPSNCTLLPSSSSLASYAYTSSSSVSSSSCSSSSLSLSPTSSPVTYSTCVSASSTSLKENEENEILTPDLICNCQKTHETGKFMKLGKLLKERKQTSAKNAEDVCEPRDGLVVKCIAEHGATSCFSENKFQSANTSHKCCSQQYLERSKKNELKCSKTTLDEIYPFSVSRRPSVRDILSQQNKVSDYYQTHQDLSHSRKKEQKQMQQQQHDYSEEHRTPHQRHPRYPLNLFSESLRHNATNNIPEKTKTNSYISNGYARCLQANPCTSGTDYLFYENNLNMGVVPPPNLNPFTS